MSILSKENRKTELIANAQDSLKRYFKDGAKYKKYGLGFGAYLDLEFEVSTDTLQEEFIPRLNTLLTSIREEIAQKQNVPINNISWMRVAHNLPRYLSVFTSDEVRLETLQAYHAFLRCFTIKKFAFHAEVFLGAAAGFKLGAGLKAALDARIKLTVSYDQTFIENDAWLIPINDDNDEYDFDESALVKELQKLVQEQGSKQDFIAYLANTVAGMPIMKAD